MTDQLKIQLIICTIVVSGFFLMVALYVFHPQAFEGAAKEPLLILTGVLGTAFTGVVSWTIQSNIGSARTKELLAKSQPIIEPDCTDKN
jgi:hypothetical protein